MVLQYDVLKNKLLSDYNVNTGGSGISSDRIASRLATIANIGLTKEGGSNRLGFTKEEREAKNILKKWMIKAGLDIVTDGIGNIFGRLKGKDNNKPVIM